MQTETGRSADINLFNLFAVSASKFADRPALKIGSEQLSYAELSSLSASIAAKLKENAAGQQYIGLFCHRSIGAYAGILGILAAGKTYVPLNPKFPADRNAAVLTALGIKTIICDSSCSAKFNELKKAYPALEKAVIIGSTELEDIETILLNPSDTVSFSAEAIDSDTEAYVLFTSGSTGKPKGVPITHANVSAYLSSLSEIASVNEDDRVSQIFDLTFDLSVHDIFLAFSSGACLCVVPERFVMAPSKFIQDEQITVWFSVPSVVSSMMRLKLLKPGALPSIKQSFFCGEPLNVQQVEAWRASAVNSKIWNVYGPTEATIAISSYEIPQGSPKNHNGVVSLGKIFPAQKYKIQAIEGSTDKGELLLGGTQLSKGYINDPEKNKAAFEVIDGVRFYKTGDVVREDEDGDLFFIERKDFQVKINGYRVELDEINNLIKNEFGFDLVLSSLKPAVQGQGPGLEELVTFIEEDQEKASMTDSILEFCRKKLPAYMVPKELRFIKHFPRNFNGKVDLKELVKL